MGRNAKKLMGGKQAKVPIKKTVTRKGKTFQQTFYVSPQEAMAMQRSAKKEQVAPKKKPKVESNDRYLLRKAKDYFKPLLGKGKKARQVEEAAELLKKEGKVKAARDKIDAGMERRRTKEGRERAKPFEPRAKPKVAASPRVVEAGRKVEKQLGKDKKLESQIARGSKAVTDELVNNLSAQWRKPLDPQGRQVLPEPPPPRQHIEIALKALSKHRETLPDKLNTLKKIAPPGSKVIGRVKEWDSAVGKVQRKPKYGTADKLQDLTGTRVVMNTSQEVVDTVKELANRYEIVEQDDYITELDPIKVEEARALKEKVGVKEFYSKHPEASYLLKKQAVMAGGYRSFHVIAKDEKGQSFEIQVRTKGQNTHAKWAHDVYKPQKPEEKAYARDHSAALAKYGRDMSAFFTRREKDPKIAPPPCPTLVAASPFGCMKA